MSEPADDRVTGHALAAALVTPVISLEDPAPQHRVVVVDLLPGHRQAEAIQQTEAVEIRTTESSVRHVEVFQMDGVGTSIIGRPRPSPQDRRAHSYTLNCEDPDLFARIGETLEQAEIKEDSFRKLEEEILAVFAASADPDLGDDVHLLPNLALLDRGQNSVLGNSVFEVKRQEILRLDRLGAYIPPCTRNALLKYYTKDADQQIHMWGPQDRDAYYEAMRALLNEAW